MEKKKPSGASSVTVIAMASGLAGAAISRYFNLVLDNPHKFSNWVLFIMTFTLTCFFVYYIIRRAER